MDKLKSKEIVSESEFSNNDSSPDVLKNVSSPPWVHRPAGTNARDSSSTLRMVTAVSSPPLLTPVSTYSQPGMAARE